MIVRALPLALALAALRAPAAATPLDAGRVASLRTTTPSGAATVGPLPSNPWLALRRVELPSPTAGPALRLDDGTLAVPLDAPPAVAFVDREETVRVARLSRRITQPLAASPEGVVWAVAGSRVFTVAPDGTVRSAVDLATSADSPAFVRGDGSAVVVGHAGGGSAVLELSLFDRAGDLAATRRVDAQPLADRALLADGRVVTASEHHAVTLDARGAVTRTPCAAGLRRVVGLGDAMAWSTDRALLFADARAVVQRAVPVADAPAWLAPLDDARVAWLAPGPVHHVVVTGRDGVERARAPVPTGTAPPLVDPSGAMLVTARGGELVALSPDGVERWRIALHENLRPPAVALPRGGVAVATEGNQLLFVSDGP